MLPELGQIALLLALVVAALQALLPLLGAQRDIPVLMAVARPAAWLQLLLVGLAFAILTYAFVVNDFSVQYVAENSNSLLPTLYRYTAVWGAHEGSLLLWALVLALWTAAVARFSKALPLPVVARVLGVMGVVSVGFLAFLVFTSNPFIRILPAAGEGRDLNPLLQDPGLIVHPPMLYAGYVGLRGAVRLRHRRAAGAPHRRAVAALDAALDQRGLGLPHPRHRAGLVVGLLRAGLGRLVVLGPGGERQFHAVAGRRRAAAFAGGHRKARQLRRLDPAAGHRQPSRCRCWAPSWCAPAC